MNLLNQLWLDIIGSAMHITTSRHVWSNNTNAVPDLGTEEDIIYVVHRSSEEISSRRLKHKE